MELRHLRCFVVLAEELHFTRAAERLHIEQPPLSRAIKELEDELGVVLFDRNRRGTVLTAAGAVFLQDVRRLFTVLEQARENAKAVASGLRGSLRIAVSDGAIDPRLSAFLARCRAEEPEIEIRLSEVPLAEQVRGLRSGDFMIGFAHTADVGDGIAAEAIWHDPLVIAVASSALIAHLQGGATSRTPRPSTCPVRPAGMRGLLPRTQAAAQHVEHKLNVVEEVSSLDMMLTLVGAGYGIGFMTATKIPISQRPDVVIRPWRWILP